MIVPACLVRPETRSATQRHSHHTMDDGLPTTPQVIHQAQHTLARGSSPLPANPLDRPRKLICHASDSLDILDASTPTPAPTIWPTIEATVSVSPPAATT
jgi:hypothetical protein